MMKKIALGSIGLLLVVSPFLASADTLSDLQAQIQALLAQLKTIQLQMQNVTPPTNPPGNSYLMPSACPIFTRTLVRGIQGGDVKDLQSFLVTQGLLSEESVSGYFGPLTEDAVQKWQSQNGVISSDNTASAGWGIFGSLSRAALARWCGGGWGGSHNFSADPTSGSAPLVVNFSYSVQDQDHVVPDQNLSLDFGDGTSATPWRQPCDPSGAVYADGSNSCQHSARYFGSHTYTADGTYVAKLMKNTCPPGAQCLVGPQTVGSITITVGSTTGGASLSANPTSGAAPLTVGFDTNLTDSTGGNYVIEYGDGDHGLVSHSGAGGAHTYQQAGTYTATLNIYIPCLYTNTQYRCMIAQPAPLGTVTITVSGGTTGGGSLTAIPASGTAPLAVHFRASDSSQATGVLYTVDFGDGSQDSVTPAPPPCAANIQCPFIGQADHTYGNVGTYTATLYKVIIGMGSCVTWNPNCARTAIATATVSVSGGTTYGLTANPTSGSAPLTVGFTYDGPSANNGNLNIDFGDGSSGSMGPAPRPMYACPASYIAPGCGGVGSPSNWVSHTYKSAGNYTAIVTQGGLPLCYGCHAPVLGTANISVSPMPANQGILTVTPSSGPTPLTVTIGALRGDGIDFGDNNSATGCASSAVTVSPVGSSVPTGAPNLPAWSGCNPTGQTHIYQTSGTYTVRLLSGGMTIDSVTVYVGGGSGGGAPTISGLDAPTSLQVGQAGTWTVHASAPVGTQLRYSVYWGDEPAVPMYMSQATGVSFVNISGTFTHAYSYSGAFNPTFTVSNDYGSAQTSGSVQVGSSNGCPIGYTMQYLCMAPMYACTDPYNCSRPSSCSNQCMPIVYDYMGASSQPGSAPAASGATAH